jgi:hypothetical protein
VDDGDTDYDHAVEDDNVLHRGMDIVRCVIGVVCVVGGEIQQSTLVGIWRRREGRRGVTRVRHREERGEDSGGEGARQSTKYRLRNRGREEEEGERGGGEKGGGERRGGRYNDDEDNNR